MWWLWIFIPVVFVFVLFIALSLAKSASDADDTMDALFKKMLEDERNITSGSPVVRN
jgi:hypothetical protein